MKFSSYASSSAGNLYSIEDGQTSILVECGVSYRAMQELLPRAPGRYDACVYSHHHGDHYNGKTVAELRRRGVRVENGLMFQHGEKIGSITLRSFEVRHDCLNHGYMFRGACGETCLFLVDTFYCPIIPSFSPTIIAIECNWARDLMYPGDVLNDRLFSSHMSLGQCIETLKSWPLSTTREIHLLHLSDQRSDEGRFIREVQAATGVPTYVAPKRRRGR